MWKKISKNYFYLCIYVCVCDTCTWLPSEASEGQQVPVVGVTCICKLPKEKKSRFPKRAKAPLIVAAPYALHLANGGQAKSSSVGSHK